MANFQDFIKNAIDKLNAAVTDLSTIEVTTISGDVSKILKEDTTHPGTYKFPNKAEILNILGGPNQGVGGNIYLVAYTNIDIDQDTINFVKKDLSDSEKALYEVHINSLKAAQEARAGFLKMLAGLVGGANG